MHCYIPTWWNTPTVALHEIFHESINESWSQGTSEGKMKINIYLNEVTKLKIALMNKNPTTLFTKLKHSYKFM